MTSKTFNRIVYTIALIKATVGLTLLYTNMAVVCVPILAITYMTVLLGVTVNDKEVEEDFIDIEKQEPLLLLNEKDKYI
jgi:hypothetical protein